DLAVHEDRCALDPPAVDLADRLVTETHAEHRAPAGEGPDGGGRLARPRRNAGARRHDQGVPLLGHERRHAHLVVTRDALVRAQLREVLDEIPGERVVVVDGGDLHRRPPARSSAASEAPALPSVSSSSLSGSESATIPAPDWT